MLILPLFFGSSLAQCEEGWLEMSSSCYLISPGEGRVEERGTDWAVARKICADHGGYLAEITSEEEWAELEVAIEEVYGNGLADACHSHQCHLYIGGLLGLAWIGPDILFFYSK